MREMIDYGVLGFLLFLSVIVMTIALERIWFYATMRVSDYTDKRLLEIDLHKRLTLVATIGANAPYVGLLGTVAGIMVTFSELGNSTDTQNIMTGLSLALKATAAGLLVAIPSIVAYNLLIRKAEVILIKWDIANKPIDSAMSASHSLAAPNLSAQPTPTSPLHTTTPTPSHTSDLQSH